MHAPWRIEVLADARFERRGFRNTQTQRFKMAEVFNDLSSELNRRKSLSQRKGSLNAPGLSFLRVGSSRQDKKDLDGGGVSEQPTRRTTVDDNSMADSSEWLTADGQMDRDSLEPPKGEKDRDGSPGTPNNVAHSTCAGGVAAKAFVGDVIDHGFDPHRCTPVSGMAIRTC
ncbi:hypothetical protein ACTXT7_005071 [Hymenolepis weldensis]